MAYFVRAEGTSTELEVMSTFWADLPRDTIAGEYPITLVEYAAIRNAGPARWCTAIARWIFDETLTPGDPGRLTEQEDTRKHLVWARVDSIGGPLAWQDGPGRILLESPTDIEHVQFTITNPNDTTATGITGWRLLPFDGNRALQVDVDAGVSQVIQIAGTFADGSIDLALPDIVKPSPLYVVRIVDSLT